MQTTLFHTKKQFNCVMFFIIMLQMLAAFYFCTQKQGFHYDEYYSYYSSNVTYGLVPSDSEWKSTDEIKSEFKVMPGEGFQYKMVSTMQSYDVHPPLYYFVLHTVCSLSPGIFSKWQGLTINLIFFLLSIVFLLKITSLLTNKNEPIIFAVCLLYGFSPAALSGVTFIRMYMMLTFFCFLSLYIHCKAIILDKKTLFGFYVPVILTSYLGFLTHYYFIVFLFFEAALTFLSMIIIKKTRKNATCYAASIIAGLLLAVMTFPSCLGHIFRGYRGTEAKQAFFDMSNITTRLSFFFNQINEYVFGNMLYFILLILFLIYLTYEYKRKKQKIKRKDWTEFPSKRIFILTSFIMIGYFLVVAKTALLNAEEAIRYEMPIYGISILILIVLLYHFLSPFSSEIKKSNAIFRRSIFGLLVFITLVSQIIGLFNHKVLFLYEDDKENKEWASAHNNETVAYMYHDTNQWMIWDDSEELMQYKQIYFANLSRIKESNEEELDTITFKNFFNDDILENAKTIYVYAVRDDSTEQAIQLLIDQNSNLQKYQKIRELRYCDLYELK